MAIITIISGEDDPSSALRNLIKLDANCGIGHTLLAIQNIRSRNPSTPEEFINSISKLEDLAISDKLTPRERYFSAAALAWHNQQPMKAAALFESAIMESESDALALRFAQDCYFAAGDTRNVLSCVTRNLQVFDNKHYLHGYYQGMLALGFLETYKFIDAEEISQRSISMTRGRDLMALNALLGTYQLTGRTSELASILEDHRSKYEGSTGIHSLLYHEGAAKLQRGNTAGAKYTLRKLVEELGPDSKRLSSSVALASLLLWQLFLNVEIIEELEPLATSVANLWTPFIGTGTGTAIGNSMWEEVTACMALGLATSLRQRIQSSTSSYTTTTTTINNGTGAPATTNRWDAMLSSIRPVEKVPEPSSWAFQEPEELLRRHMEAMEGNYPSSPLSTSTSSSTSLSGRSITTQVLLEVEGVDNDGVNNNNDNHNDSSISNSKDRDSNVIVDTSSLAVRYPTLMSIQPTFKLTRVAVEVAVAVAVETSANKNNIIREDNKNMQGQVCLAIQDMIEGRYDSCADRLLDVREVWSSLGGSAVQRDVLSQTLIEAFMKSGQLQEARMLLLERTAIAPNEAQSWRRLGIILNHLGQAGPAEAAEYTAWQLGIGQGGFGGLR
eukprot:gene3712-7379_t